VGTFSCTQSDPSRERERFWPKWCWVYASVFMCIFIIFCVCVCVCVCERERERERERLRECEYVSEGLCMCEHMCVCLRMSAQDCVRGPLVCVREGRCISMEECAWMCVCPCKCLLLSVLHRPLCFCLHKVCQSDRAASSPCNDLCLSSVPMLSQIQAT